MITQIPWIIFFIAAVVLIAGLVLLMGFKMPASFWQRQEKREQLKKQLLEQELLKPLTPQTKLPTPDAGEEKKAAKE